MEAAGGWTIVTGPSGVGKSTVAGLLATGAGRPTVHLHTDSYYAWIRTGFIAPYLPESAAQNEVVMDAVTSTATAFARGGYDVVLDGVIGPWFVDRYRERAVVAAITVNYVILNAPLDVVLRRATERPGELHLRDPGPLRAIHEKFADLGPWTAHAVATGERGADEVVAHLRERLPEGTFRA